MHQITLPLSSNDSYSIDEFIESSSNRGTCAIIRQWYENWGHPPFAKSILVYGPRSSGKTYISKLWQALSCAYLINLKVPFDREVLATNQAFIIEDIENASEDLVLHYFNLINESNKYLLLTTSNKYNHFKISDLSSRINSLLKLELKEPDDELVKILLFKLFSNHSIKVSKQILDFLPPYLPRQFNRIISAVDRINKFALVTKRNVTVPLIKKALGHEFWQ